MTKACLKIRSDARRHLALFVKFNYKKMKVIFHAPNHVQFESQKYLNGTFYRLSSSLSCHGGKLLALYTLPLDETSTNHSNTTASNRDDKCLPQPVHIRQ